MVSRSIYPQVPPRVEYELTPLGRGLLVQVTPLWFWIARHSNELRSARANYGKDIGG
ncbi:winged helix-turn-helix transcriptional regulator [Chitinophaga sp. Ak27]|uniref:winged helix-turn-helix transcriptional regulator n=1 Tax=Chitinophaga sp. Ak27 TaxID=2726116 RepID=UPI002006E189